MNKKFYGTLLLGTLLLGSTIVSCKDYDDDIDNLQDQITQLATKADLESKVSALESSLSAAKASAESAVTTATQALADAKAAADKANSASDAADKAAAAVKAAEEALAAAEKKVAAIEEQLAAVETLKADLQAYTEAEIEKLKTQIATDIDALKEEVQGLVGLHYVDLMMSNATPFDLFSGFVSYVKFTPKATDLKYKTLKAKFPELAEIEGTNVLKKGQLNVLVVPANAEMKPEYTYELIDKDQEVAALEISNPVKGLTRASGSEYWNLEVAPTFNEKGKINEVSADAFALRVKEGDVEIYKTDFSFPAMATKYAEDVEITCNSGSRINSNSTTYDYIPLSYDDSEIDLLNDKVFENGTKPAITIENGLDNYYIFEIKDIDNDNFNIEKAGISIEGSTLKVKDLSKVNGSADIFCTVTALGANGSTARKENLWISLSKEVEASVTLASKQIELGNKNTYTLRYSVDSLGLTPSVIADGGWFNVVNEDGKEVAIRKDGADWFNDAKVQLFVTETSSAMTVTGANARKAKFIGFTVDTDKLIPGSYTVKMHVGYGNSQVIGEGELSVVNSGTVIKLIEALCDENGVLQAVGNNIEYDQSDKIYNAIYDVEQAIILKGAKLVEHENEFMIDLDATETSKSWVDPGTKKIKIAVNGIDVNGVEHNDINNTVRNLRLHYNITGTPATSIEAFDFQVMMMSAVYSEDPTQVITVVENKNIYFTATPNANPADNKFDLTSVVTKAVYACGNKAGQEYRLFPTFKDEVAATDPVYLTAYDCQPYQEAREGITTGSLLRPTTTYYTLLTDKDGVWTVFTKAQLKALGLLDADALNKISESANLYLQYNTTNIFTLDEDNKIAFAPGKLKEGKTIMDLHILWNKAYKVKTEDGVSSWAYKEDATQQEKEDAEPFNTLKSTMSFKIYKEGTVVTVPDGSYSATVSKTLTGNGYVQEYISNKGTDKVPAGIDKEREKLIKSVVIKFNDEDLAAKFVKTTSWTDDVLNDTTKDIVEARQDYDSSQLVDNQITLDATITIVDLWGMKMEVPFKVTCKVNPVNPNN